MPINNIRLKRNSKLSNLHNTIFRRSNYLPSLKCRLRLDREDGSLSLSEWYAPLICVFVSMWQNCEKRHTVRFSSALLCQIPSNSFAYSTPTHTHRHSDTMNNISMCCNKTKNKQQILYHWIKWILYTPTDNLFNMTCVIPHPFTSFDDDAEHQQQSQKRRDKIYSKMGKT